MNYFDIVLLDIVIVIMPILTYLIYVAYVKTISKDENDLVYFIFIISEFYLVNKYSIPIFNKALILINIPLVLSYYKKSNKLIFIMSLFTIFYYSNFYSIWILIIEYSIYYLVYKYGKNNYLLIITIIKILVLIMVFKFSFTLLLSGISLYVFSIFIICFLNKSYDMFSLHKNLKKIEHEKEVRDSLFRITHEIKNPIAVCKGYLDMYDSNKHDKFKKYVPIIKEEIDRTLILLEDFLTLNKGKINKDIVDINMLLDDVTNNMSLLFKNNNIKLDYNISDDEIYINADYNRLTQVFINIFKNSIEAIEKKGIIKVWTEVKQDDINIFIKDSGKGIHKDILKKIKEPFYTTKIKGTGLGVSLSDEIIKKHGGTLDYSSKEGSYTLVTITLPLEKAI